MHINFSAHRLNGRRNPGSPLSLCGRLTMTEQVFTNLTNAGPVSVYVKDGKVVRIRPLVADEKDLKPWVIEAGGRQFSPLKNFIWPHLSMPTGAVSILKSALNTP